MTQQSAAERRAFPRVRPSQTIRAQIGGPGMQRTMAVIDDISRGGVKLAVRDSALGQLEQQCVVLFSARAGVVPSASRGWIRRTERKGEQYYLAVEFTEPLVSLEPGPTVSWSD